MAFLKIYKWPALLAAGLAFAPGLVPVAIARVLTAPSSPSAQNEWKGATTGLGSSHRFPNVAAAKSHCGDIDTVVWSDGYSLTYVLPGSDGYGQTKSGYGFYACKSEADSAGFHAGVN